MNKVDQRIKDLQTVPGRVEIDIQTYKRGDARFDHVMPDGTTVSEGASVSEWRRRFGGDETVWTDPIQGKKHRVSLAAYANLGDDVMLRIGFRFEADKPVAPEHQHLFPSSSPEERARGVEHQPSGAQAKP